MLIIGCAQPNFSQLKMSFYSGPGHGFTPRGFRRRRFYASSTPLDREGHLGAKSVIGLWWLLGESGQLASLNTPSDIPCGYNTQSDIYYILRRPVHNSCFTTPSGSFTTPVGSPFNAVEPTRYTIHHTHHCTEHQLLILASAAP